jgi:hypothetical protein
MHGIGQQGHGAGGDADADLRRNQDRIKPNADCERGIVARWPVMMVAVSAAMPMAVPLIVPACGAGRVLAPIRHMILVIVTLVVMVLLIMIVAVMRVIMWHAVAPFDVPCHHLTSRPMFFQDINA